MKVLKKLPYFASWEVKRCVDNVFAERNSTSIFVFQKFVRRKHLKIFLGVSLGFFVFCFLLWFFVFCFFRSVLFFFFLCHVESRLSPVYDVFFFVFCSMWKVVYLQIRMFLLFFFLFKISCWDVFFILGVHSRVRG